MQPAFHLQAQAVHQIVIVGADQAAAVHREARGFVHRDEVLVQMQEFKAVAVHRAIPSGALHIRGASNRRVPQRTSARDSSGQ
ncbi:hypothetical protein GCM10009105_05590 [Dokdonella soli]|uniref:Uncharacterized protein n=1 Tax=Dokdonella soli TaxID=529810 RepID=A0ABP3TJG2_9GAMM